jgi:hypothetical protein
VLRRPLSRISAPGSTPEGRTKSEAALTITIPASQRVLPLPGRGPVPRFRAEAGTRPAVENALGTSRDQLRVVIE